jgi:hypothetical protein
MRPKSLLFSLALVPLCLALAPRAEEVRFAPAEGSSLKKAFKIDLELELDELTMVANGADVSDGVPQDFMVTAELAMTVVDTYVELEEQKPLDLIRLYDSLSATWEGPDGAGEGEGLPELAGKRVRFQWEPDTETYAVSYHESEGSAEDLEGLGVDMDLRSVLPSEPVSAGDTWTIDPEKLVPLLFFGAELEGLSMDLGDDGSGVGPLIESELLPQLKELLGELVADCTYAGSREVDGRTVGAIDLELGGEGTLDLEGLILGVIDVQVPDGMEVEVDVAEAVVGLALDGTGTLLWDLEAGHLHSFELTPELEITVDVALSVGAGGETQDFELGAVLQSSGAWAVEVVE